MHKSLPLITLQCIICWIHKQQSQHNTEIKECDISLQLVGWQARDFKNENILVFIIVNNYCLSQETGNASLSSFHAANVQTSICYIIVSELLSECVPNSSFALIFQQPGLLSLTLALRSVDNEKINRPKYLHHFIRQANIGLRPNSKQHHTVNC